VPYKPEHQIYLFSTDHKNIFIPSNFTTGKTRVAVQPYYAMRCRTAKKALPCVAATTHGILGRTTKAQKNPRQRSTHGKGAKQRTATSSGTTKI
jgi:hypothetical protein